MMDDSELKIKAASNWISVLATNIPDRLNIIEVPVLVTLEMLIEESALKSGIKPTSAHAFAASMARPSTDWVLYSAKGKTKLSERLFEEKADFTSLSVLRVELL